MGKAGRGGERIREEEYERKKVCVCVRKRR